MKTRKFLTKLKNLARDYGYMSDKQSLLALVESLLDAETFDYVSKSKKPTVKPIGKHYYISGFEQACRKLKVPEGYTATVELFDSDTFYPHIAVALAHKKFRNHAKERVGFLRRCDDGKFSFHVYATRHYESGHATLQTALDDLFYKQQLANSQAVELHASKHN